MKFLNNFSFKKLLYDKRFLITVSIIAAFICWLSTSVEQHDTMDRTFTDIPVTINMDNTYASANNMSVIGDISDKRFTVSITGPSYLVSSLTASDIVLYASASTVDAPGEYSLDVALTKSSSNAEYSKINIYPASVTVNFDYIETQEFTIEAVAEGATAAEGLIAESGVVSGTEKDSVEITGPRTVLNKISKVAAIASVNKTLSESESFDANIVLYDADGNNVDQTYLTVSETKVKVTVPISKKKTVPVVLEFTNLPDGFDTSTLEFDIDYSEVTIIGDPDTIDNTTQVSLSAIDISTLSPSNSRYELPIKLPDGVRLLDSIEYCTVEFSLSAYAEKTITVTLSKFANLGDGLSVDSTLTIKNVKICGPKSAINKITGNNVIAVINLLDKVAGEHSVTPSFLISGYNNIWVENSYTTTVSIK